MEQRNGSDRAARLAARLQEAAASLIAVIELIDDDGWQRVPMPGTWSIGKEAEHVAEAAVYHQWIVRLTIGHKVPSRRPSFGAPAHDDGSFADRGDRTDSSASRGRGAPAP